MERVYAKAIVTEKAEALLRAGHPWVYADEVVSVAGSYENGGIVDVLSRKGKWLGAGYLNDCSKIRIRVISRNTNDRFDAAFYERRVRYAIAYRRDVMREDFSSCRLIFGEADQFPGLTVDKFEDVLVTEVLSLGTERVKTWIYDALLRVLAEQGVSVRVLYERSDSPLRDKEGMSRHVGFYAAPGLQAEDDGHVCITENGICYDVDYINGQKTGFFLDQKYNRLATARLAAGRNVLDCCTHTGAFALNCAKEGASHVTAVDVSASALESAEKNANRNGLHGKISFVREDVFDLLDRLEAEKRKTYDFIILDPPAFTKSGATVAAAYGGYKDINAKAMRILPRGGYLATCSCSHFMTPALFVRMLKEAAAEAGVMLRQIAAREQCADHPILWNVPETEYLKFYLFQVV